MEKLLYKINIKLKKLHHTTYEKNLDIFLNESQVFSYEFCKDGADHNLGHFIKFLIPF